MGFEQAEAQRRGLCFSMNRRLFGSMEQRLTRVGRPGVWCRELCSASCCSGLGSVRWEGALWVLDRKGGCSRKCYEKLAGGRLTGGRWNNPSVGWGSLAPCGCLGQTRDPREWVPCGTCEQWIRKRRGQSRGQNPPAACEGRWREDSGCLLAWRVCMVLP